MVSCGFACGFAAAQDPAAFELGEVVVRAGETAGWRLGPGRSGDGGAGLAPDVTGALRGAPGFALGRDGSRNETIFTLRGFDSRSTPVYLDGIPLAQPYDGSVDLARWPLWGLDYVAVRPGFTDGALLREGPGGQLALVSGIPTAPRAGAARLGLGDGERLLGAYRFGIREPAGFSQADLAYFRQDHFRLSRAYDGPAGSGGARRVNSGRTDLAGRLKAGWTPAAHSELTVGYHFQRASKEQPPYAGADPFERPRYWRWPQWDRDGAFVVGRAPCGPNGWLQPRLYWDRFENTLAAYDDASYTTRLSPRSFTSVHRDTRLGANLDVGRFVHPDLLVQAQLDWRQDRHRETQPGQPARAYTDQLGGAGLAAAYAAGTVWELRAGLAWQRLDPRDATNPGLANQAAGAAELYQPHARVTYRLASGDQWALGLSESGRFPTQKERYAFRLDDGLPNPGLQPERVRRGELSWQRRQPQHEARLTIFAAEVRDAIRLVDRAVFKPETGAYVSQVRNVGRAIHYGVEASGARRVARDWTLRVQVDYLEIELDDAALVAVQAPRWRGRLTAAWEGLPHWRIEPGLSAADARYARTDGGRVSGHWLADMTLRWLPTPDDELALQIENLLDENYALYEGYPEAGRQAWLVYTRRH
ncbi:MAG: TonB-dependent receptor [Candidatus Marinimicrobia bacterium]|nr:TonB-dependent receptor [Candidatus Neomarinimicrobiota bacterium]